MAEGSRSLVGAVSAQAGWREEEWLCCPDAEGEEEEDEEGKYECSARRFLVGACSGGA